MRTAGRSEHPAAPEPRIIGSIQSPPHLADLRDERQPRVRVEAAEERGAAAAGVDVE